MLDIVWYKTLISVALSVAVWLAFYFKKRIIDTISGCETAYLWLAISLFRLFPFVIIYGVLQFKPQSDVLGFYDYSRAAWAGQLPYRDFWMPYSPLFPYVNGWFLWLFDSPTAITAWMIVLEISAVFVCFKWLLSKQIDNIEDRFFYSLVYLMLPAPFIFCVVGGQEDITLWLAMLLGIFVWQKTKNEFWVAVALSIGLLVTKPLLLFWLLPLVFYFKRPLRYIAGGLLVGLPAALVLYQAVGTSFLSSLDLVNYAFAPNLGSVLSPVFGGITPLKLLLNWGALVVVVGVSVYWSIKLQNQPFEFYVAGLVCVSILWLMMLHKNSLPNYLYLFMLPLVLVFAKSFTKIDWILLILLNIIGAIQPSLWYRLGAKYLSNFSELSNPIFAFEYLLEVLFLVLLLILALKITKKLKAA